MNSRVIMYPVYTIRLDVPSDSRRHPERIVVDTRMRIFDERSMNCVYSCLAAGVFGRIRPDHVLLQLEYLRFLTNGIYVRTERFDWDLDDSIFLTHAFTREGIVKYQHGWFQNPLLRTLLIDGIGVDMSS